MLVARILVGVAFLTVAMLAKAGPVAGVVLIAPNGAFFTLSIEPDGATRLMPIEGRNDIGRSSEAITEPSSGPHLEAHSGIHIAKVSSLNAAGSQLVILDENGEIWIATRPEAAAHFNFELINATAATVLGQPVEKFSLGWDGAKPVVILTTSGNKMATLMADAEGRFHVNEIWLPTIGEAEWSIATHDSVLVKALLKALRCDYRLEQLGSGDS